jgi:uracil-DNA glycosylase family 4
MTDERKEIADIARAARRYVERERAAGIGDLLADGAARAARESGPMGSEAAPDGWRSGGRADPSDRESLPVRPAAGRAELPPPRNLFGEPEPMPVPTRAPAVALDEHPPSMFEEGLDPAGLEARATLAASAIAVLDQIAEEARACTQCGLCETRTQAVPGVGTARAGIVFVGEAPGADEDRLGEPFVGRAGQLLDRIIKAMDDARLLPGLPLDRSTVYICNVLKCRPPENRNPLPHEVESCSPYLRRQLEALRPRIICCLGKFAAELLVGVKGTIGGLRGKVYRYRGAKLIVTYHPAACLRNPAYKRPVWEDMQLLAREYLSD